MFGSKKPVKQDSAKDNFSFSIETMEGKLKGQEGKKDLSVDVNNPPQNLPGVEALSQATASVENSPFSSANDKNMAQEQDAIEKSNFPAPEPMTTQNLATSPFETTSTDKYQMSSSENFSEENEEENKRVNKILVVIAAFILIITIFVGAYYYFFILKSSTVSQSDNYTTTSTIAQDSMVTPETTLEEVSNIQENISSIENFQKLEIGENLITSLKNYFTEINKNTVSLSSGYFLELTQEGKVLSANEILAQLGIELNSSITLPRGSGWLFVDQENDSAAPIKVSLILGYTRGELAPVIAIKNNEKDFPIKVKTLFINETAPHVSNPSTVNFATSSLDDRFRFYNYLPEETKKSVDWGVVKNNEIEYLIITTSKDSTKKILSKLDSIKLNDKR